MKKHILVTIIAFVLGFFTHAFFFPQFLANGVADVQDIALPADPTGRPEGLRDLTTKIYYDGEHFNKHVITMEAGTYLMVINSSKNKLMNLTSNNPSFVTPRGYAESEAARAMIETKGTYVIADKNNPSEKLVVTVQ